MPEGAGTDADGGGAGAEGDGGVETEVGGAEEDRPQILEPLPYGSLEK